MRGVSRSDPPLGSTSARVQGESTPVDTPSDDACGDTHAPGDGARGSDAGARPAPPSPGARPARTPNRAAVPAEGPGSLLREGNRLVAEVRFDRGALAALDELRAAGARVLDASRRYQTVTVAVRPGRLRGARPRSTGSRRRAPVPTPLTLRHLRLGQLRGRHPARRRRSPRRLRRRRQRRHRRHPLRLLRHRRGRADPRRAGRRQRRPAGAGNPCGFTAPVSVFDDSSPGRSSPTRAGRWRRSSTTWPRGRRSPSRPRSAGETAFADSIRGLAAAGARVIVDDVGYFEEPFFQDGPVAVAIDEVVGGGRRLLLGGRQRQPDRTAGRRMATSPPGRRRNSATPRPARRCSKPRRSFDRQLPGLRPRRRRRQRPSGSRSRKRRR